MLGICGKRYFFLLLLLLMIQSFNHSPDLQYEAARASGSSDRMLMLAKAGAIPKFVNLLRSNSINVAEQSVGALGNIGGAGAITRDEVLKYNTVEVLLGFCLQKNQLVYIWIMFLLKYSHFIVFRFDCFIDLISHFSLGYQKACH